jgi:hypothetical protein
MKALKIWQNIEKHKKLWIQKFDLQFNHNFPVNLIKLKI